MENDSIVKSVQKFRFEMFAKFSIMAVSVPVLLTLLETIEGLLGA